MVKQDWRNTNGDTDSATFQVSECIANTIANTKVPTAIMLQQMLKRDAIRHAVLASVAVGLNLKRKADCTPSHCFDDDVVPQVPFDPMDVYLTASSALASEVDGEFTTVGLRLADEALRRIDVEREIRQFYYSLEHPRVKYPERVPKSKYPKLAIKTVSYFTYHQ